MLSRSVQVGVLALQGAYAKHCHMLQSLQVSHFEVRKVNDLQKCDGLIIPGGESTAILNLLKRNYLVDPLINFKKPIYGTCAGLILLSKVVINDTFSPLGLIDISVERNAYGRQINSFSANLTCHWKNQNLPFEGFFIRAPKINSILSDKVEVLVEYENQPVFVKQGNRFASSFHPELTTDTTIHEMFVNYINSNEF